MTNKEYWRECLESSLSEHGITFTEEQIKEVAIDVYNAYDCYDMAFPHPAKESPNSEVERLKRELKIERGKILCSNCKGAGNIVIPGPYHVGVSTCGRCNGEGRVA